MIGNVFHKFVSYHYELACLFLRSYRPGVGYIITVSVEIDHDRMDVCRSDTQMRKFQKDLYRAVMGTALFLVLLTAVGS